MNDLETIYQAFLKSTGISTDTRQLNDGNLFFALKGPNFDANQWVMKALEAGASFAVADDPALKGISKV